MAELIDRLDALEREFGEVEAQLADPEVLADRGERDRNPQQATGEPVQIGLARPEAELQNHHGDHDEQPHRDNRVARAHLKPQVLSHKGADLAERPAHATSSR